MPVDLSSPNPQSEPADSRTAILHAAIGILHSEGAAALTVRSVAAAAGCSTSGVYTWFGGKPGLVEAIFVEGFKSFGGTMRTTLETQPVPDLPELLAVYRQWAISHPTQYMVMFGNAVPDYQPSAEALGIALATFDILVSCTADATATLRLAGEASDTAHHLWAGIHGYVSLELARMDMDTTESARAARFQRGVTRLLQGCMTSG